MFEDALPILAVLCLNIAASEWLVRKTALRHLGAALLVIVLTAITANLGLIPTVDGETPHPVYDTIFAQVAPLGIFWLLLQVRLSGLAKVGRPLLVLFLLGSLGTVAGVICGMLVVDGATAFGTDYNVLGGMFVGTYTGGSANFLAVAEGFEFRRGTLFLGAVAADSAMTTVWMAINVAVPRLLDRRWPDRSKSSDASLNAPITGESEDTEAVHPMDVALLIAVGALSLWASRQLESMTGVPYILILTTLALVLGQTPIARVLKGSRMLGMFAVMIFLAVIGALCDVGALIELEALGLQLSLFVVVVVLVHGLIVYGAAALFRIDAVTASIASQANIGGGTSALALARSLGRANLVLPAILIGSLGTALGTYLGFMTASWLL
ncbi:MAG: putative membrane protein [Planctomycetota bacterium]